MDATVNILYDLKGPQCHILALSYFCGRSAGAVIISKES